MRIYFGLLVAITVMTAGCGYGSRNYMNGSGMPKVVQLSPTSATAGGPAFVLTIQGSGFGSDSIVYWGTSTRTTFYGTAAQLTAQITAADIMNPGMVPVYVHSGGVNSNAVTFTVQ